MAGIGFTLKKLFRDEIYSKRVVAYLFSGLIAAGPWIISVVTVNILVFYARYVFEEYSELDLFMGTMVYAFVFSQIITAPFQMVITRYVSDQLYSKKYEMIRPSYRGLCNVIATITAVVGFVYHYNKGLPPYYLYMAVLLFVIISLIWITMVYLSAVKDYTTISLGFLVGGMVTLVLAVTSLGLSPAEITQGAVQITPTGLEHVGLTVLEKPLWQLPFHEYARASHLLFSYLCGMIIVFIFLLYSFVRTFNFGTAQNYDFLRYFSRFPTLFFAGFFYTAGLWADDIIMWYSEFGKDIQHVYQYSPLYDNAVFMAYLTIIPTMIYFMVAIETDFYDTFRKYYGLASADGTMEYLESAKEEMKASLYRSLIYTLETQTIITVLAIILSGPIFSAANLPLILTDIFRICALGSLCNIFIMLIFLVLLYFEAKGLAVVITFIFMVTNIVFTIIVIPGGENFYGVGYFASSFVTMLIAWVVLVVFMKKVHYHTFSRQPLFHKKDEGVFVSLADWLNQLAIQKET